MHSPQSPKKDPLLALLESIPLGGRLLLLGPDQEGLFPGLVQDLQGRAATSQIQTEVRSTRTQDPRLMTLARESWDAIYWDSSPRTDAPPFPLEQVQRVLLTCFQALRPARGLLALSAPEESWDDNAIQSLIRQSGFQVLGTWNAESISSRLWLLQRV